MVLVCFDTFLFWIFWQNMLQTGMIIGGWDKYEGGKIYGVPLGGTLLELPFTIGGV
jgi:20S proteasome subunit beta 1